MAVADRGYTPRCPAGALSSSSTRRIAGPTSHGREALLGTVDLGGQGVGVIGHRGHAAASFGSAIICGQSCAAAGRTSLVGNGMCEDDGTFSLLLPNP